ncbi:g4232 [Coccomyxa elongata]
MVHLHPAAIKSAVIIGLICSLSGGRAGYTTGNGFVLQSNYTTGAVTVAGVANLCASRAPAFPVVEATIGSVHTAFLQGNLTCSQLVQAYVQRIQAYDKATGLLAVRVLNPDLEKEAAAKDQLLQQARQAGGSGLPGGLFCVPVLVKDNFDTLGMASAAGSAAMLDNFAPRDAQQVARLKAAGAIILGKGNMGEWAFSPVVSISSVAGVVRNPYDLDRTPAGSSGGPAAGVAANFALVGLGTDTGNSVRGPASHTALVGLRPSLGLTSRAGIVPLDNTSDISGPLARSVEDVARMLEALAAPDPADPLTLTAPKNVNRTSNFTRYLSADGLKGARVGVLRQVISSDNNSEVMQLFQDALDLMSSKGAQVVEDFKISGNSLGGYDWDGRSGQWWTGSTDSGHWEDINCGAHFKYDLDYYLQSAGTHWRSVEGIADAGLYHPTINSSLAARVAVGYAPADYPSDDMRAAGFVCGCGDYYNNPCRAEFRKRLIESMNKANLDVVAYPTWSNPPRLIGDYFSADGNDSPQVAPPTGAPAMTVPMGFVQRAGRTPLPAGLQFLARPWDEGRLLHVAFAYEQATRHRRPPAIFPECTSSSSGGGNATTMEPPAPDVSVRSLSGR